jgi:hypothetical protein
MKGISFLYILIFFNLSKKAFQQQILIPLDPGFDDNSNDNDNDNDNDQDVNQSIVETKEIKSSDGSPIKITRIHYHKSKNLNGDSEAITPFQMLKIFDDRVNSIFEEFVKESMGISNFFHRINMDFDNDDDFSNTGGKKRIKKMDNIDELFNEIDKIEKKFALNDEDEDDDEKDDDFDFKIINTKNEKSTENKDDEKEYDPKLNDVNQDQRQKKIKERKNKKINGKNEERKKNEKTNENNEMKKINKNEPKDSNIKKDEKPNENIKSKKVKRNKLTRKQLIFSRICKYIFYTMILFAFYFIIKKILEFLEIIDPEGASEYKILDEEAVHLKKEDNKQY